MKFKFYLKSPLATEAPLSKINNLSHSRPNKKHSLNFSSSRGIFSEYLKGLTFRKLPSIPSYHMKPDATMPRHQHSLYFFSFDSVVFQKVLKSFGCFSL